LLGTLVGGRLISAYLAHRLVERPFASRPGEVVSARTAGTVEGRRIRT
jgi:hypothetical protein